MSEESMSIKSNSSRLTRRQAPRRRGRHRKSILSNIQNRQIQNLFRSNRSFNLVDPLGRKRRVARELHMSRIFSSHSPNAPFKSSAQVEVIRTKHPLDFEKIFQKENEKTSPGQEKRIRNVSVSSHKRQNQFSRLSSRLSLDKQSGGIVGESNPQSSPRSSF